VIDHDTRFLVASHFSYERDEQNARVVFKKAKQRATKPREIFTDGLPAYPSAIRKVWYRNTDTLETRTEHIRIVERHDYRNNIIERIQGTLRERVKVMRGFENPQSAEAIMQLLVINYNFVRVHMGLGMTPAEMCGIRLNLKKNRWLWLVYRSRIQ